LAWRLLEGVFMRQLFIVLAALAWTTVALPRSAEAVEGEPLYFSLEFRQEGRVVAAPKLLGLEGKPIRVERRKPGATSPEYRLVLFPNQVGGRYDVAFDLELGGAQWHYDLQLDHGHVRKLAIRNPQSLDVELTLFRVDSPEFRALMGIQKARQAI
jgi:hypothetical protein